MNKELKATLAQIIKNKNNNITYQQTDNTISYTVFGATQGEIVYGPYLQSHYKQNYIKLLTITRTVFANGDLSGAITVFEEEVKLLYFNDGQREFFPVTPQDIMDFEKLFQLCQDRVLPTEIQNTIRYLKQFTK